MSKVLSYHASGKYDVLPTGEAAILEEERPRMRSQSRWGINFWFITTIFFASLSTWLGAELHSRKFLGSFEKGFSTEFGRSRIPFFSHHYILSQCWLERV